jgi:hypothetical protein
MKPILLAFPLRSPLSRQRARRWPAPRLARKGACTLAPATPTGAPAAPPSRTDWTRLVPPPVLTGCVSSLPAAPQVLQCCGDEVASAWPLVLAMLKSVAQASPRATIRPTAPTTVASAQSPRPTASRSPPGGAYPLNRAASCAGLGGARGAPHEGLHVRAARPPPPPSRTKWTRLVHPSVLTGHVFPSQVRAARAQRLPLRAPRRLPPAAAHHGRPLCRSRRASRFTLYATRAALHERLCCARRASDVTAS